MRRMREILFRGKTTLTDEWVYGFYQYCEGLDNPHSIVNFDEDGGCDHPVRSKTVGQYIDQKDITEKRIFEDDIIEAGCPSMGGTFNARLVVCFHEGVFGALLVEYRTYKDKWEFFRRFRSESLENIKVVGTRFDNRGLLRKLGLDRM